MLSLFMLGLVVLLFASAGSVVAISIDNEVLGEPEVSCLENKLTVRLTTTKPFKGSVYVKGYAENAACSLDFYESPQTELLFAVPTGECGMGRQRTSNASVTYTTVVVVKFHHQFLTKVDRAFHIGCHFDQSPRNVTSGLTFAEMPASSVMFDGDSTECEYSLRKDTVDGPVVQVTILGDTIIHRWQCNQPNHGILVSNCIVKGPKKSFPFLDERGCPVSDVFGGLTYDHALTMAFVSVESFQMPDYNTMNFECVIQLCPKPCTGISPPNCPKVTSQEFRPNSVVQESSDDTTQVIGVFDEPFPTTSPNPNFRKFTPRRPSLIPGQPFPISGLGPLNSESSWGRRRLDQPLAAEVKAAVQAQSQNSLLVLKRSQQYHRARRDDERVKVRTDTILVGNWSQLDTSVISHPTDSGICLHRRLTMPALMVISLLAVYCTLLTAYVLYDFVRMGRRSGKFLVPVL